jgi:uncharacterized protein (TIGR00297 family)
MTPAAVIAIRLVLGLALSAAIGWIACRRGLLTRGGAAGAVVTGTLTLGLGGLMAACLLIAFFASSSALSRFRAGRKAGVAEKFDKTGRRDLGQALANGGAAAAASCLSGLALLGGDAALSAVWIGALAGALASANADTWATELGVLSQRPPRLITRPSLVVEPGTSGGVTLIGLAAAAAGAAFIGLAAAGLWALAETGLGDPSWAALWVNLPRPPDGFGATVLGAALMAGMAGALCDSLLGAALQGIYISRRRGIETERPREADGQPNRLARGWRWMTNDWVNFISSMAGAGAGAFIVGLSH